MNDRRIDSLIRMASEIDEMERAAGAARVPEIGAAGGLRLVHAPGDTNRSSGRFRGTARTMRIGLRTGAFAAAAACVGLAIYFGGGGSPAQPQGRPIASTNGSDAKTATVVVVPPKPAPPIEPLITKVARLTPAQFRAWMRGFDHSASAEVSTGVLAIFQDSLGVVRCVKWQPHDFGGRAIDKLNPGELVEATYGPHCSVIGPHRLIAVAVTGPKDTLPDSDERAQALAQCLVGETPKGCEVDPESTSIASEWATGCVPRGLHMMVETLAMGKP